MFYTLETYWRRQYIKVTSLFCIISFNVLQNHGYGNKTTCHVDEDDFYFARDQLFNEHPSWLISRENVTFDSLVANGRFANIYKAISHHGTNRQETVVAKTLKGDTACCLFVEITSE